MRCKWFADCPIVKFNERGLISDSYLTRFCKGNFDQCRHYQDNQNEDVFDVLTDPFQYRNAEHAGRRYN